MSDNCSRDQFYDKPAGQCMPCEDICLPIYDTLRQCLRDCLDFAVEEGYIARGPVPSCEMVYEGLDPIYVLPIMLSVMLVTAIFVLFMETRYKISERLPCWPKLGGEQPEDGGQEKTELVV